MAMCFSSWDEEGGICGVGDKECAICSSGDGGCLATMREDLFSLASERQLVERLNEGKYPDYKQLMIDTLKRIYNHEYTGTEELKPLPKQLNCCTQMHSICDTCRKKFVCLMPHIEHREKCGFYEPLTIPEISEEEKKKALELIKKTPICFIKEGNNMEAWEQVEKTRAEAEANAWKDRLKEEYAQLKERYEKLKAYNNKQEVEAYLLKNIAEEPEDMYSRVLLKKQQSAMGEYLHILELRAELAHIEL